MNMHSKGDAPRKRRRGGDLAPDPGLWRALGEGLLLREILEDFYTRVLDDEKLAPFFVGITHERIVSKQYSFLLELFTGERVYFGDRPRNAHHWMVISNELFDYREDLLETCALAHGLGRKDWERWRRADEVFRKQIVKDVAVPKKIHGRALPLDGYEELILDCGSICDGCADVLEVGTRLRYHVRTGKSFCAACAPREAEAALVP